MDEREAVVEMDHPQDGVTELRKLFERVVEQGDDFFRGRGHVGRSGDPDLFPPVLPRRVEDSARHNPVEGLDCPMVHAEAGLCLPPDPVVRVGVVRRLHVLPEALPPDRDALLQDQARLLHGEGVPLDCVAVVRVRNPELFAKPRDDVLREGPSLPERAVVRFHPLPDHGRKVRRGYRYRHLLRTSDTFLGRYRYRDNYTSSDTWHALTE